MKTNVEIDRLSSLPDDLIHKILSFVGIKCAIQTSFLSPRWRFVWTSMPYLNFSSGDFLTLPKFSKFVSNVLSHRNNQIEVSSVKLSFRGKVSQVFVKKIMNYAFAHNVQQLTVTWILKKRSQFPLSVFGSQSLKHLSLTGSCYERFRPTDRYNGYITPTSTWDLPALTRLYLSYITLYDDDTDKRIGIFSKCANLKNLTLNHFTTMGLNGFSICHPRLSNLTLESGPFSEKVNVVAPQLENLTIINCAGEHLISAPELASLIYKGYSPLKLSADGFHSLEKVDLCFKDIYGAKAHQIVILLQQFHSAKSLTLNSEFVEFLSSSAEVISHQPSPFANLKSLMIYPLDLNEELDTKVTMSNEVKNYLLENSPSTTFTIVSRKEMRAVKNAKRAQELMLELDKLLEKEKANSEKTIKRKKGPMETHDAEMQVQHEQGTAQTESHNPEMQVQYEQGKPQRVPRARKKLRGTMAKMNSYWNGLEAEIREGKSTTNAIFSKLLWIEELLPKLPKPRMAEMKARFSHLCAEADTLMKNIADCKKIRYDKKKRRLNVYFRELATASQTPSHGIVPTPSGISTTPMQ